MDDVLFDIQRLVAESGVPRRTIHFYVQQGLLPPPRGAGLAASYGEEHRLRLAAIPVLRQQGLRLDAIRLRFRKMTLDDLRGLVAGAGTPASASPAAENAPAPRSGFVVRETRSQPVPPGGEQRFLHYSFPAGVTLVVPEALAPADRQRVDRLLQDAYRIFSPGYPTYSTHNPGTPDTEPTI